MNKRSNIWKKRQTKIQNRESNLKSELEEVSTDLENQTKNVLKIAAVSGTVLLFGYGIYNMSTGSKKKPKKVDQEESTEPKKIVVKEASSFNLKNLILERLAIVLIQYLGKRLGSAISDKLIEDDTK